MRAKFACLLGTKGENDVSLRVDVCEDCVCPRYEQLFASSFLLLLLRGGVPLDPLCHPRDGVRRQLGHLEAEDERQQVQAEATVGLWAELALVLCTRIGNQNGTVELGTIGVPQFFQSSRKCQIIDT